MALIRHKKHMLSAGLSWNQLTQKNYKAEAINLSEHEGRPFGCIYKTTGDDGANSYLGLSSTKAESGKISAAAIFASLCENGMIIDSVTDKTAWWCASINNQILTQTDKIYDKDDLTNDENGLMPFIEEALPQIMEDDSTDFKIYAAPEVAELIQDLVGEIEVVQLTLSDLISDYEGKFPGDFSKYRIKKISGSSPLILIGAAAIILGSGYYFFFYEPAPQSVDMDMSGLSSMNEANNKVDEIVKKTPPGEQDKIILDQALQEEKLWLIKDMNNQNLSRTAKEVFKVYKSIPLYAAGWGLTSIVYDKSSSEGSIVTKWHKDFGTPADFRYYWDQVGLNFDIEMDGKTGYVYFPFSIEQFIQGDLDELYEKYKNSNYDSISLMSSLDKLGFNWGMSAKPKLSRRENIKGLHNQDLASVNQLPLSPVAFEINGKDSVAGFFGAIEVAGESDLILVDQVQIDVTNGFDWFIKGELYNVK